MNATDTPASLASTCPHAWCGKTELHDDEDGHWAEVPADTLGVLFDSSRISIGLFDDFPGVNVSVELTVSEPSSTTDYLRDIATELLGVADRVDAMIGADA